MRQFREAGTEPPAKAPNFPHLWPQNHPPNRRRKPKSLREDGFDPADDGESGNLEAD